MIIRAVGIYLPSTLVGILIVFVENIISLSVSVSKKRTGIAVHKQLLLTLFFLISVLQNLSALDPCPGAALGFKYEKIITINDMLVIGNNTDFPVLINIFNSPQRDELKNISSGGKVYNTSGYDIIFTDMSYAKLDFDLDSYDPLTGNLVAWVKVPSLNKGTTTQIRMLYGNPAIVTSQSSKNTWDSNFEGVWHLNADCQDATSNLNDGNNVNTTTSTGPISACAYFNDPNDKIIVSSGNWTLDAGTVEAWFNTAEITDGKVHYIFGHGTPGTLGNNNLIELYLESNQTLVLGLGAQHALYNLMTVNKGVWYHVVMKWDGNGTGAESVDVYVNGELMNTATLPYYNLSGTNLTADIGNNVLTGDNGLTGFIDEFRVSKIARSNDWIKTEFNNQSDPVGFISISAQIQYPDPVISGRDKVCPGESGIQYTSPLVAGHTYNWSITGSESYQVKGDNAVLVNWLDNCNLQGKLTVTETDPVIGCSVTSSEFNVDIGDVLSPVFTKPANITIYMSPGCAFDASVAVTGDVTDESDNCQAGLEATFVDVTEAGTCDANIIIKRIWSLTDKCGNTAADQIQVITVADNTAPSFTRPPDITIFTSLDCQYDASIAVTGNVTDENDNCSTGIEAVYSDVIQDGACQGTFIIKRTWHLEDKCGNMATDQIQVITVKDILAPSFTRPPDIEIYATALCTYDSGVVATGDVTNETDNCSTDLVATFSDAVDPGLCEGETIIKRTWHLEDKCGNAAVDQVQTITVRDNIPPSFTRPPDITVYTSANCAYDAGVSAAGDVADESDNCSSGLNATYSDVILSGTCTGTFVIKRTWHLEDKCGNAAADQIQTITVSDNTAPEYTLPPDITIFTTAACTYDASVAVTGNVVDESDNCSTGLDATFTDETLPGTCIGTFIIKRTWHLEDDCGNSPADKIQVITVSDNSAPTFTRPSDITIFSSSTCSYDAGISVTGDVTDELDNCSVGLNATFTDVVTAGSCEGNINISRTWHLVDNCGNPASDQVQTITVKDNTAPTFTRPPDKIIYTEAECSFDGSPEAAGDVTDESDNCSTGLNATFNDVVEAGPTIGTFLIHRTWHLQDKCGNMAADQVQLITVNDNIAPTFTKPEDITIFTSATCTYDASVSATGDVLDESDNCSTTLNATFTDAVQPGSCPGELVIRRTWHLADLFGNAAADQVQIITVLDKTPPSFTRPADITIYKTSACTYDAGVSNTGDVFNESDNCSSGLNATFTDVIVPGSCEGTLIITRTWHLADNCGNSAADQIQVINVSDNMPPTFSRPADITIYTKAGCLYDAGVEQTGDVTDEADNCSAGLNATFTDAIAAGSCEGTFFISRTWHLEDKCGNKASDQVQLITVNDNTAPAFSRPADITIYTTAACTYDAGVSVTGDVLDESDNCSTGLNAVFSDNITSGSCEGTFIITRTWHLEDKCGNAAADQIQKITVSDNTPPTFTRPADIIIYKTESCAYDASVSFTGDVSNESDNCSVGLNATFTDLIASGSCEGTLVITRTWHLTDNCGNSSADQIQTITVRDNIVPTFTRPADITIYTTASCTYNAGVTATGDVTDEWDNCSTGIEATFTDVISAGSCEGSLEIIRTWHLSDKCGNAASDQVQVITVRDNIAPTFTRPSDITIYTSATCAFDAGVSATGDVADESDNCTSVLNATYNDVISEGTCEGTFIIARTWHLADKCGNVAADQVQVITVSDNIAPAFTVPSDVTVCRSSDCSYDISVSAIGDVTDESDNCSNDLDAIFTDQIQGTDDCNRDIFITRRWILTDKCGNSTVKLQIIRVEPLITASIVNSSPVLCNGGKTFIIFNSPTESTIPSELRYQVTVTSTDPANLGGGASGNLNLTRSQLPFYLISDLTNSSNEPITVTYTLVSGIIGCSTTTSVSTTVIVNPSASLLPLTGEIVCNGSSTTEVPFLTLNTGGSVTYSWINDQPSVGLAVNGSGDKIESFTAVNNSDKFITANILVKPFFSNAGLTCDGPGRSFAITVNPTPRVIPVNPGLKPDSSICNGGSTAIILTSPTVMTSGSVKIDYTVSASDISVTGNMSPGTDLNPGYTIASTYQNNSNKIQSVYYSIIPRNNEGICSPGNTVISEIKVHPSVINFDYPVPGGDGIEIVQPLTCEGGSNASLRVYTSDDAGPYYFYWERSSTLKIEGEGLSFVENLIGGGWQVTVTDALGCKSSSFKDIAGGAAFNTYYNAYKNVTCPGGSDGALAVAENGTGNPPYNYEIHRIHDGIDDVVINGTIETKGTYIYHQNLLPGIYRLFMRDNSGCSNVNYIHPEAPEEIITQPDPIEAVITSHNESCRGNDGTIDIISVKGGTGSYTYAWFYDPGHTNPVIAPDVQHLKGLIAGTYYLDITDSKDCIQPVSVIVDPPEPVTFKPVPSDYNGVNISCNGLSDGSITIVPVTGTEPYQYFLKKPDGTEVESATPVFSNLPAGRYLTSVIDSNYCTASDTVELHEPGKLSLNLELSESKAGGYNINCAGQKSGTIDIDAVNAVSIPVFIWSDGFIGSSRKDLPAGSYSVVAIDANNCREVADTVLTEPSPLNISIEYVKQPLCPDKPDGEISVLAEGGVKGTDYYYLWSDNSTGSILTDAAAGEYTVTVTDLDGCTSSLMQKMEPVLKSCLVIPNAITPNGDTKNDVWNIGEIGLYPEAEVKIFNRLGQLVWRSEKGYPDPWDGTSNGTPLPFDSYHYIIDLHNNTKQFIGSITIIK